LLFFLLPFFGTAWLGRHKEDPPKIVEVEDYLDVDFVELEVTTGPPMRFQILKLYTPVDPFVARWLNTSRLDYRYEIDGPSLTVPPRIRLTITSNPSESLLQINNTTFRGISTMFEVPENVNLKSCKIYLITAATPFADMDGMASDGAYNTRAVMVQFQVPQTARDSFQNSRLLLGEKGHPLRYLLLPWIVLLLPLIVGSAMGPMALLGGAALTLASIACLSFLIAILVVIVQRRCLHCTRKYRRLWRLRALQRRPSQIRAAFGDSGPCCICLGDADSRDTLIALLPCRHALHATCYSSWVSADAYPSSSLICPVCRCRADSIGKLAPLEPT